MDQGLKGGAAPFGERAGGALWRPRGGWRADSRGFQRFFLVGFLQASFETASSAQRSCRTEGFPLVQASSTLISCTTPSDWFCQDDWALASLGLRAVILGGRRSAYHLRPRATGMQRRLRPLPGIEPRCFRWAIPVPRK